MWLHNLIMAYSTKIKQRAEFLRKRGFSIKEIAKKLSISPGTASLWLKNVSLSKRALSRINNLQTDARQGCFRIRYNDSSVAQELYSIYTTLPDFISGKIGP